MRKNSADSFRNLIRDYGGAALVAILIALTIRFFVLEAYRIPGATMRPTLESGDTIFVAKWPYGIRFPGAESPWIQGRLPRYGEVVIYSGAGNSKGTFIKRVVGLPGDTVEIKSGSVILNGKLPGLSKSPAQSLAKRPRRSTGGVQTVESACAQEELPGTSYEICREPPLMEDLSSVQVPEGSVFVLGDLRSRNPDFRRVKGWELVPVSALEGKALWIWLSIEPRGFGTQAGVFSRIRFDRMFQRIL